MIIKKHQEVAELWLEYRGALEGYLFKRVRDRDTAQLLSSEVLLKVYASCCSGRTINNVRSWLFQIAHNSCMDHFKKEQRSQPLEMDLPGEQEEQVYREASDLLAPLIRLLPEKYARPLVMSEIENLKQKEVAERLQLSLAATKSRILRAKEMLREQIVECIDLELGQDGRLEDFKVKTNCNTLQEHIKDPCKT